MDEQYIEVPSFEFLKIINKTKFAISNDETRHYLNGVYLDKNENQLIAVATDGHRLVNQQRNIRQKRISPNNFTKKNSIRIVNNNR